MLLTLKQARKIKDFSQEKMAKELGVHVQTYRKIEENPDSASVLQAKQISDILEISYDQIFFCPKTPLKVVNGGKQ